MRLRTCVPIFPPVTAVPVFLRASVVLFRPVQHCAKLPPIWDLDSNLHSSLILKALDMLFQDSSKNVYLKGESNTLYPGLEDPIFQLLSLCDFPHPFRLSGSPFSWCWLQSWLLIYLHCCCFPQMGLPLSQSGKRKGKKS